MTETSTSPTNDLYRPLPSSREEIDQALGVVSAHRQKWVDLPIEDKIALLEQVQRDFKKVWDRWVEYSVEAKGTAARETGNDHDWLEVSPINRLHSALLLSLNEIRNGQRPTVPGGYRELANGQVAARVFPNSLAHAFAFRNVNIDVWLEPDVTLDEAHANQAEKYFKSDIQGKGRTGPGSRKRLCTTLIRYLP